MKKDIDKEVEICDCCEVHENLLQIVNETIPEENELYDLAELFKVFGDSTRIRILFVLFEAEVCVCDLAKALNMTQSAISHQLRILKQKDVYKRQVVEYVRAQEGASFMTAGSAQAYVCLLYTSITEFDD